jgi:hypothetical protein
MMAAAIPRHLTVQMMVAIILRLRGRDYGSVGITETRGRSALVLASRCRCTKLIHPDPAQKSPFENAVLLC